MLGIPCVRAQYRWARVGIVVEMREEGERATRIATPFNLFAAGRLSRSPPSVRAWYDAPRLLVVEKQSVECVWWWGLCHWPANHRQVQGYSKDCFLSVSLQFNRCRPQVLFVCEIS